MPAFTTIALIATIAVSVVKGVQESRAASKAADVRNERLNLERQQQEASRAREVAQLKKSARIRSAAAINRGTQQLGGTGGSTLQGAEQAIASSLAGELGFSAQSAALARSGDEISRKQIRLDASRRKQAAITDVASSVANAGLKFSDSGGFDSSTPDDDLGFVN